MFLPFDHVLGEAFLAQERMRQLQSTPEHLTEILKKHAIRCLKPLKHELDPEDGWSELASLDSRNKQWIHKFIDHHHYLSRLFRKVSNHAPSRSPPPFPSEQVCMTGHEALLILCVRVRVLTILS
jgi:hypothetical protein